MSSGLNKLLKNLRVVSNQFDEVSEKTKFSVLKTISKTELPLSPLLNEYQNLLLFLAAHPSDNNTNKLVESEMKRLSSRLKSASVSAKNKLTGTGLPYTTTRASFTHDLLCLMQKNKNVNINYYSSEEEKVEFNHLLSFTLPEIEKDHTSAGLMMEDLFETLGVNGHQKLDFLIEEFKKLNHIPFIKDFLLDKLDLFIEIKPKNEQFSKINNHLHLENKYKHRDLLKKFDHYALLNTTLPEPEILSESKQAELISVMQNALALLERETDPCTFIDDKSLRFYQLERGISVAIFGMIPERQMSVESYVGYTLFKNGYPCAYGGSWIYGDRALFGINIFEQFRGGESGFILMQLLRTYKQVFQLNYFEVEPYQYGLDNPEGIESGAFWFYYRYGFRPLDKSLNKVAQSESEKIKTKIGYRSSSKTLIRFTESNIGWNIEGKASKPVSDLRAKVTLYISKRHKGNRNEAINSALKNLSERISIPNYSDLQKRKTLNDYALIVSALNLTDDSALNLIPVLVSKKTDDLYSYNQALTVFQKEINQKL